MSHQENLNHPEPNPRSNLNSDPVKLTAVHHSRISVIRSMIENYDGSVPFHSYLKSCFIKNKNYGSRDRKIYTAWCFSYFRLGNALSSHDFNTRIMVAWYLVHGTGDPVFETLNEGLFPGEENKSLPERVAHVIEKFPDFVLEDIFPFDEKLSGNLLKSGYALTMLTQPSVWIRAVSANIDEVKADLELNNISFRTDVELPFALELNSGSKLDELATRKKSFFEIQDRSSQVAGAVIPAKAGEHWWDCCCGAGGKTLEILDMVPGLKITATDSRPSILKNFRERTVKYQSQLSTTVLDLEQQVAPGFFGNRFDGILADVPCSGSGTWSRSPENLQIFKSESVQSYVKRQKAIVSSSIQFLKSKGHFVYITCSIFKAENEDMTQYISSLPGMALLSSQLIQGSEKHADSMYYAIFSKA